MKRANGAGSVVKHGGNRRRPYEARVTVGLDEQGRQQRKAVGYYATRDEAMVALLGYNKSPYDIDARTVTMAELFGRWHRRAVEQGRLVPGTLYNMLAGFNKHCPALHGMPYHLIKAHMIQDCIDQSGGYAPQRLVKNIFYHLDRYAIELDIIPRGYSDLTQSAAPAPKEKRVFSDMEAARLWDNLEVPWVDTVLILLYSGWRAMEFLSLRVDDINFEMGIMRGGSKTRAGKDRIVPIHSAIEPLIRRRSANNTGYLVHSDGKPIPYRSFIFHFERLMASMDMLHTPHECRHTFRSWLDRVSAPLSCVNRIMGHSCGDVGLQTYTHKTIEELRAAIEMIKTEQTPQKRAVGGA